MDVAPADLDALGRHLIQEYRWQGRSVRNKVFNFGFKGPSRLDIDVPILNRNPGQTRSDYDRQELHEAADRPVEDRTELHQSPERGPSG